MVSTRLDVFLTHSALEPEDLDLLELYPRGLTRGDISGGIWHRRNISEGTWFQGNLVGSILSA